MDEATWAALAAALTVAGAIWTWIAFQRRGLPNGLRALGFTLLPVAAWLTGTLELVTEVGGSIADWASGLVFNPFTWAGIGMAGLSVVLWVVSGVLRDRQLARGQDGGSSEVTGAHSAELPKARKAKSGPVVDDEMAEIEALLKKRGIS